MAMDLVDVPRDMIGEILLGPMACSAMAQRHVWPPYVFLHDLQRRTQDETVDEARMVLVVVAQSVCRQWRDVVQKTVLDRCCAPLDDFSERCIKASAQDDVYHWAVRHGCRKVSCFVAVQCGRFDMAQKSMNKINWRKYEYDFLELMAQVYSVERAEWANRRICAVYGCLSVDELHGAALGDMQRAATGTANFAMLRWIADRPNHDAPSQGELVQLAARTGNIELFEYIQWLCTKDGTTPWELDVAPFLWIHVWFCAMLSKNEEFIWYIIQRYPRDRKQDFNHNQHMMPVKALEFIRANLPLVDTSSDRFISGLLHYNMVRRGRNTSMTRLRLRLERVLQWLTRSGLAIPRDDIFWLLTNDSKEEARRLDLQDTPNITGMLMMRSWNILEHVVRERTKCGMLVEFSQDDLADDVLGGNVELCQRLFEAGAKFQQFQDRPVPRYASHDLIAWLQSTGNDSCQQLASQMDQVCGIDRLVE